MIYLLQWDLIITLIPIQLLALLHAFAFILDRLNDKELSVIEATVNGLCKVKEPGD